MTRADVTVTSRVAGIVLALVASAVGVVAAAFLSHPAWGVLAALVLAAATVGVLAGGLWIPRRSWADKTWPRVPARVNTFSPRAATGCGRACTGVSSSRSGRPSA